MYAADNLPTPCADCPVPRVRPLPAVQRAFGLWSMLRRRYTEPMGGLLDGAAVEAYAARAKTPHADLERAYRIEEVYGGWLRKKREAEAESEAKNND